MCWSTTAALRIIALGSCDSDPDRSSARPSRVPNANIVATGANPDPSWLFARSTQARPHALERVHRKAAAPSNARVARMLPVFNGSSRSAVRHGFAQVTFIRTKLAIRIRRTPDTGPWRTRCCGRRRRRRRGHLTLATSRASWTRAGLRGLHTAGELDRLERLAQSTTRTELTAPSARRRLAEGRPHWASPDKIPARRLETIRLAGELSIPFTSGILNGTGGETRGGGSTRIGSP